jgi:hypothetical protein
MRKLVGLAVIVMIMPAVSAYTAELTVHDQQATRDDPARFTVDISDVEATDTFRATVSGTKPQRFYVGQATEIQSGANGSIEIEVTPEENAIEQRYGFTVFVKPRRAEEFTELKGAYYISRDQDLKITGAEMPERLEPGENFTASIDLRSISGTTVDNYSTELQVFNTTLESTSSPIIPGGERTLEFEGIAPLSSPSNHTASFRLFVQGELEQDLDRQTSITEVREVERTHDSIDRVLYFARTEKVENLGNTPRNVSINYSVPSYLSSITSSTPEPDSRVETDGSVVYSWERRLQPGESTAVTSTTSYWVPLAVALLGVVSVYGVRKLSDDLEVKKRAESVNGELKISIEVENASRRTQENVSVKEFVPDIADVIRDFQMADPKIRNTSEGTELEWNLGDLRPGEKSILQYRVKPKVEVEEGVTLQSAKIYVNGSLEAETTEKTVEFSPE